MALLELYTTAAGARGVRGGVAMLVDRSHRENVTLRDFAERVVDGILAADD
ncbi:hypothetical protein ACRAKI_21030 [Saccharothrix isguenensis]